MARFVGTTQEFHHFVGPRIRNVIQTATAGPRKQRGDVCEECGQGAKLEAAHIHGRGRRTLIEGVLKHYTDTEGIITCDLDEVEQRILEAHTPIDETFRFLCSGCHTAYDVGTKPSSAETRSRRSAMKPLGSGDSEFAKLHKIEIWSRRPAQVNHRMIRAFLLLEEGGGVELDRFRSYCVEELGITGFNGNYANMKTDAAKSHGKVFYDDGAVVRMWDRARQEVDRFFGDVRPTSTSSAG
jgi:hypothetical protein